MVLKERRPPHTESVRVPFMRASKPSKHSDIAHVKAGRKGEDGGMSEAVFFMLT